LADDHGPSIQNIPVPPKRKSPADLEACLQIDREDLDGCLIEQPDSYYHVSVAFSEAVSRRDGTRLELEEWEALLDRDIRAEDDARPESEKKRKLTEAAIQQTIRLDPRHGELRRRVLDLTARADALQALREAFQQRSFMLRELVALAIAERGAIAGAGGAYDARARRAEEAYQLRGQHLARSRGAAGPRSGD
jgi:hypothetical protein